MLMKLMTRAALVAAILAGAMPAQAQSFQKLVETFYDEEFRAYPIAATAIGVHDYDAEIDDLTRDGQAKTPHGCTRRSMRLPQSIRRRCRPATAVIGRC